MKENLKNKKGITLISLVVTIIVLIILAGVSINLIFGEYGIITRAQDAKTDMEVARVKEEIQLKLLDAQMEKMRTNGGNISEDELEDIISKAGGVVETDADGKITGVKVGDTTIPIEEITGGIEVGEVTYAPYDAPYIPAEFSHTEGTWNSGYTIRDTLGNEFVWVPCVLDQAKVKPGDNVETFKKTLPTPKEDGTLDTTDPYYNYLDYSGYTIIGDENPASDIRTSVGKYGGFYIAKYEAGIEGTEENYDYTTNTGKTTTNGTVKPLSQSGKGLWNGITREEALTVAGAMVNTTDGVKSGLISGECWDTTLQWMVKSSTNASANTGYDINYDGEGWYRQTTMSKTGYYAVNGIYDMGGNACEITTENVLQDGSGPFPVARGGDNDYQDAAFPPATRWGFDFDQMMESRYGFRVVLYKSV